MEYEYKNIDSLIEIKDDDNIWKIEVLPNIEYFLKEFDLPLEINILNYYTNELIWETNLGPNMWATYDNVLGTKLKITTKNGKLLRLVDYSKIKYDILIDNVFNTSVMSLNLKNGVVVGAGDGNYGEWITPVRNKNTGATLIEADEREFKKLRKNYSQLNNVILMNVCVDIEDSTKTFWISPYGNVSSLKKENCLKYNIKPSDIIEQEVKVYSLDNIMKKFNFDWLRLDVEGLDSELIYSLSDTVLEKLLYLQYEHINTTEDEKIKTNLFLEKKGFTVFMVGIDMVAIKNKL